MSFKKDLARALVTEERVASCIDSLPGFTRVFHDKPSKFFDLEFSRKNNTNITIEVKEDFLYHQTGNIAIETRSRGAASGISTTTAYYIVYVLGDDFWLIPTHILKYLMEDCVEVLGGDIVRFNGRDIKSSVVVLMPVEKFTKVAHKLNKRTQSC